MKTIITVLSLFSAFTIYGNVIINEVLANVKGSESGILSPGDRNEFVELFNNSEYPVKITDYIISDGDAEDRIVLYPCSLLYPGGVITDSILPAFSYAVILDPEYSIQGDTVNFMPYEIPSESYVFTLSTTTFGATGLTASDFLYLYDSDGILTDTYGTPDNDDDFPYDPGDGVSMEKINPSLPDSPSSYKPCIDSNGCTPGKVNSVFTAGSIIERCYSVFKESITEVNVIMKNSGEYKDTLIITGESSEKRFAIESDSVKILIDPASDRVVNIKTASQKNFRSVITKKPDMKNSICMSEFMPTGENEWIEIFNPYELDFECSSVSIENNENFKIENAVIPAESFLVVCEDTQLLYYAYGRVGVNAYQAKMPSQPDREDTFRLLFYEMTVDSAVRGFENSGKSIERISSETYGYIKGNWDECIAFKGATPSSANSIRYEEEGSSEDMFLTNSILSLKNPILFLNYRLKSHSSEISFKLFSDTGREYAIHPSEAYVASEGTVQFKNLLSVLDDGMYLIVAKIKNDSGEHLKKIVFCARIKD